ncbi:protocadherin-18 [Octopus bimaculoides]|uniref:protocadherin-18 n=1 Tax=Octopus bimaculoides TaxID=37653 RepID=UPI00071CF5D2|nr:protocadherin-18 [Octopus bimaculoides]XP_052829076.1 protocadherin-18 [Octopus bimaculoides]|eukprot:XP_014782250.1 PREDICTED: protocadherin-18-like [Octopus bimaculoides]
MNWLLSLVILLHLIFLRLSSCIDLIYHVKENRGPGSYVGDIASDSHILEHLKDPSLITYNRLRQRQTSSSQLFNVTKTGKLFTAQTLDAESLCFYNTECFKIIKIAVRKAEAFMKILKIKVIIEDINDHQPEFPVKQVNIQFDETDGKGTMKSIPNAVDKDVGLLSSSITYLLKKKFDEPFTLSVTKRVIGTSKLNIILEKKLDRELKDSYMLQVIAKDGGILPREGRLNIHISVTDINDNAPVFTQNIYNISIRNFHPKTRPIIILSAKDLDSGENSRVSYHFSSETSDTAKIYFQLNSETGEIFVQKKITFRQKQKYKLFVEARDGGNPPLSSTAMVLVNVINQQNNAPEIDVNFVSELSKDTASISEGTKVGSFIAYVSVIDNDIGMNGEVDCNLEHEKFQLLNLGSNEYKIIMKKQVDRETKEFYDISLSCQDKGSPSLRRERNFSIQVMDVNDVQPQFTKDTFKFLTYENEDHKFPIGFVNATDADQGSGGELTYFLLSNNEYSIPFEITDYGFISTTNSLDHEQKDTYQFKVLVKDNGNPSLNNTANVIVEVMDENDNVPYFTFPSVNPFSLDVHYQPHRKNEIAVLRASDRDSHVNAFLRYEIVGGNNKQLFSVNPYTGVLFFSRTVYQNDAGSYNLDLIVQDSGTPVLSAMTTLSLVLTVSNKTAKMLTTVDIYSDEMIDMNLVIVIVAGAVIVSAVVVVSITICIVRCNNSRSPQHRTEISQCDQSGKEKNLLIYQTNNPVFSTGNPDEIKNRNTQSLRMGNQEDLQQEWKISAASRSLPMTRQGYIADIGVTSGYIGVEERPFTAPDCRINIVSTRKDIKHGCIRRDAPQYEEIPGLTCSGISWNKE